MAPPRARQAGALALLIGLSLPATLRAEAVKLVIVPAGDGPALTTTVSVAGALARRLQKPGVRRARLAYFPPQLPEPASLKAQEKQVAKLMKKAFASFENMEYDKVKGQAGEALKIYKGMLKIHPTSSREGYLTCLHLLAASALLQGESREAFQVMNDAVVFDPAPPSRRLFNPSVQELFEQVRAEPPADGKISLQTTPLALVWFNGVFRGLARGEFSLRSGLHLTRFYLPGHSILQRWVRVLPGQSRRLTVKLSADGQPENESMARLREEVGAAEPGAATSQAVLDTEADELIVISAAGKSCLPARCPLRLAWWKDGRWQERRPALHTGAAAVTAALLAGEKVAAAAPPLPAPAPRDDLVSDTVRACTLDNQCHLKERCRNGRCVLPSSVTRTWWFWTLMGAAATGVTLAIVLPLTAPDGPVIEVR